MGRKRKEEKGGDWVMSVPHTCVLTGSVGKQKQLELGWSCQLSLKDLAFLFVFLQSPADEKRQTHNQSLYLSNIYFYI